MRLTVFTSNQPRHLACLEALMGAGHEVTAVIEPKSVCPGYGSEVLTRYWGYVRAAERTIFGDLRPVRCPAIVLPMGELSRVTLPPAAMEAEQFVVFGSSYIRGPLAEELAGRALNLHLGISPEYRGSACNFWAEYDGKPGYVGAQVQRLSLAVDAGEIVGEIFADSSEPDPFLRGMHAALFGIYKLVHVLRKPRSEWLPVRPNDVSQLIRYSRGADFTEPVAAAYLERLGK